MPRTRGEPHDMLCSFEYSRLICSPLDKQLLGIQSIRFFNANYFLSDSSGPPSDSPRSGVFFCVFFLLLTLTMKLNNDIEEEQITHNPAKSEIKYPPNVNVISTTKINKNHFIGIILLSLLRARHTNRPPLSEEYHLHSCLLYQ